MARIRPEKLSGIAELLYGERRLTGRLLAERIEAKDITLWSWMNRRGMPAHEALKIADEIDQHAVDLVRAASTLRQLAREATNEETDPES